VENVLDPRYLALLDFISYSVWDFKSHFVKVMQLFTS
jgi:hypothetical protein